MMARDFARCEILAFRHAYQFTLHAGCEDQYVLQRPTIDGSPVTTGLESILVVA